MLGTDDKPDETHGHIDTAHDAVKGQKWIVNYAQVSMFTWKISIVKLENREIAVQ